MLKKILRDVRGAVDPALTGFALLAFTVAMIAAWLTHIIVCISDDRWGLLIAGAIMFPIGIIHGIGLWLGFF